MLQTCQKCGNESPTGDKFCRQCGGPFVVESEASVAATRNYVKQEPSVATAGSGYFPPSVADAIVGDTERYYQPPNLPVPPAQYTSHLRSKSGSWRWTLWIFALLLSAMIGSMITIPIVRNRGRMPTPPARPVRSQAEIDAQTRSDQMKRDVQEKLREAKKRATEAQKQSQQAVRQFHEAYDRAMEAGAKILTSGEKPIDLSQFEYPSAIVSIANRIPGYEMLNIRTSDEFDAIKKFYQQKIGSPIIEINEPYEKWLLFQTEKAPSMLIYVDSEFVDQRRILVLRYPFRILPMEDTQTKK
ncbi:MAG: hypothetical protein L0220_29550 [Acidobacteria bacterium]|nr:hypothetical protein [Acidobacteriota bacterium]